MYLVFKKLGLSSIILEGYALWLQHELLISRSLLSSTLVGVRRRVNTQHGICAIFYYIELDTI